MRLVRMRGNLMQALFYGGRFYMNNHQSYTGISSTCSASRGFSVHNVKFATPTRASAPFVLQPRVVVYDGVCHLCNRGGGLCTVKASNAWWIAFWMAHIGLQWAIKVDKYKKIRFCAVQSKAAEPYLIACGLDQKDVLRRFLFVEGPGLCHQASTALKVLSYMPLPYSILSSFLIIPSPLRDAVYDYVAKHRYDWFGKSVECIIPDSEVLDRFIDRDEMLERQNKR